MRRTKIVCTIGPATDSKNKINLLLKNGMNVARLNFSHGDYQHFDQTIKTLRTEAKKLNQPLAILQDLCGPKIRLGDYPSNGITLKIGSRLTITNQPTKEDLTKDNLFTSSIDLSKYLHKGQIVLLDDGKAQLETITVNKKEHRVTFKSHSQHHLKPHKGINLPNIHLDDIPSLTDKDIKDIAFGAKYNFEYISLSFVKKAEDILKLKRILAKHKIHSQILAKIETPQALENIDQIIDAVDAVMVARGDLGLETPIERLPLVQKMIIQKCIAAHKPVIVATQMLASMANNPIPTRAEASDVSNAVFDNTDAVMLSEESAVGNFPIKTVHTMSHICRATDEALYIPENGLLPATNPSNPLEALAYSGCQLATDLNAKFIIIPSLTGYTAKLIAHQRPSMPIIGLCRDYSLFNQLNLVWGVQPMYFPAKNQAQLIEECFSKLKNSRQLKKGDRVIIITNSNLQSTTADELLIKTIS